MFSCQNHIINGLEPMQDAASPIVLVASCTSTMGHKVCPHVRTTLLMCWGKCKMHFLPLCLWQVAQAQWDKWMLTCQNHIINGLERVRHSFSPIVLVANCTSTMGQNVCSGVRTTLLMGWNQCKMHFLPLCFWQAAQAQWDKMDVHMSEQHY